MGILTKKSQAYDRLATDLNSNTPNKIHSRLQTKFPICDKAQVALAATFEVKDMEQAVQRETQFKDFWKKAAHRES